ncbi:uncharacterized protein LOC115882163 [Sitophilus oryzae]|uniref:Uncharacterized protein LOC115882163 n=1 Tax=Sitophilus oryzae TaxID=7048 RepID=A0A6J2XXU5_SITOR|nr:uncharacterized protein LOC115882163 [Sitophilus oryzae]XP_030755898.1 uncharacterized protein LOC115882163 [Sitophilus oryzae]
MKKQVLFFTYYFLVWNPVSSQYNAGSSVAPELRECYNNTALPGITVANVRPPSSLNLLIEYIRKLEDANPTMNARQLSVQIIQRLRQDGIAWINRIVDETLAIPYAASRVESHKFQSLVVQLLPVPETSLQYGELNAIQKCSLHYMISNTIDDYKRLNEQSECARSARYTSRSRRKRDGEEEESNPDAEPIPNTFGVGGVIEQLSSNTSQCPIELGVTYSQFGAIKTGDVLAGIAAGLNQQTVNNVVDNRYAATLVGELAEAAAYQVQPNISLGASGGWNSTINPKYFFLQSNNNLQATDAELRGALDGLYMALRMDSWTSTFTDLKISQIIDMYYSPYEKGVLEDSLKACNRNILFTELVSQDTLNDQLLSFMPYLPTGAISGLTFVNNSYSTLSASAIPALNSYLPSLATSDFSCTGNQYINRVATDLHIFIDSSWTYATVQSILSYILNNIDVNKFGTRYSIYGGSTLNNTVNQTYYLSDFYLQYNQSVHSNETTGFDYISIFQKIEAIGNGQLNNNSYAGGESTIVLFVTRTAPNSEQQNYISGRRPVINQYLPHLSFLVIGSGSQGDYSTVVSNTERDVVIIQETTIEEQLKTYGQDVVSTIKSIPRAVINPSCTSQYNGGTSTFTLTQYVEPQGTNYYRISPNYFHYGGDNRYLKVREQSNGNINICLSRDNTKPDNQSSTCENISGSEYSVDITGYCGGSSASSCSPIYLSISGVSSTARCTDSLCRFPNDIKFTVTLENTGCTGRSIAFTSSPLLIVFLCVLTYFLSGKSI